MGFDAVAQVQAGAGVEGVGVVEDLAEFVEGVFGVVAPLRAIIRPSAAPRPSEFPGFCQDRALVR